MEEELTWEIFKYETHPIDFMDIDLVAKRLQLAG
jgi:hypothetical protein